MVKIDIGHLITAVSKDLVSRCTTQQREGNEGTISIDRFKMKTIVFILITVLTVAAKNIVKTKYLQFSNQKDKAVKLPVNFATLKGPKTGELPFNGFTICGSIFIGYFRGRQAFYTVRQNDHANIWFSLYIYKQDIKDQSYTPMISYQGGSMYRNTGVELRLRPHAWSHACTTIHRSSGQVAVVINGQMVHNFTLNKEFLENSPSDLQKNLILGVSQYEWKGTTGESWQSEASVANINIFSGPHTVSTMVELTSHGSCTEGDFLSWSRSSWNTAGSVITIESEELCLRFYFPNLYLLPSIFKSHPDCLNVCPRLHPGGRVPLTTNRKESEQLSQQYRNMSHDYARKNSDWIWSSFVYESDNTFVDFYTEIPMGADQWRVDQPNGGDKQQCTSWNSRYLSGGIHDDFCTLTTQSRFRCMCQLDKRPIIKLRGLCKDSNIDTHYTLKHFANGTISFLGLVGSEIIYDKPLWKLSDSLNKTIATTSAEEITFTLGRHVWTIELDSVNCNGGKPEKRELKMSGCQDRQFTYNTGDCVRMEERCDQMLNCKDGSDEEDCRTIVLEKSYSSAEKTYNFPPTVNFANNFPQKVRKSKMR